jgi:beta-lactam-binding protein with PASTA domain/Zn-dependent metalloprotease
LFAGPDDGFVRQPVQSSLGWQYVPYERTYRGLPVLGGDFVVVVDPGGKVSSTSVAQRAVLRGLDVEPVVSRAAAEKVAAGRLGAGVIDAGVRGSRLAVDAKDTAPRLVWEAEVTGRGPGGPSGLTVEVDAVTGEVVRTDDEVLADTGYSGFNDDWVSVPSALANCPTQDCADLHRWILGYPAGGGMNCNSDTLSRDDRDSGPVEWGNGDPRNEETACVDAMYASAVENRMLADWLGRNGIRGTHPSGGFAMYTDDDVTPALAQYSSFFGEIFIGRNPNGTWNATLDVVGHENGHGVDDHTPGGISGGGTREFIADAFGIATEWYANRPAPYDTPDWVLGDTPALGLGGGARLASGEACYADDIGSWSNAAAAGVGDYWLFLVAAGLGGTHTSCSETRTSNPIGLRAAMQILYNAMLMKNSSSSYPAYRAWTLAAARNLFPGDCTVYDTVRRAWDAVGVVQSAPDLGICVPGVVGASESAARSALEANGLLVGSVTRQPSLAPVGTVLAQNPAAGLFVTRGWHVDLTVSAGGVLVPSVYDRTCASESTAISAAGFVPVCTGAGPVVTAQSPLGGAVALRGSVVTLTLSTARVVPDVLGDSCAVASATMRAAQLDPVCVGDGPKVTHQLPAAGSTVSVGDAVSLTLNRVHSDPPPCPGQGALPCP